MVVYALLWPVIAAGERNLYFYQVHPGNMMRHRYSTTVSKLSDMPRSPRYRVILHPGFRLPSRTMRRQRLLSGSSAGSETAASAMSLNQAVRLVRLRAGLLKLNSGTVHIRSQDTLTKSNWDDVEDTMSVQTASSGQAPRCPRQE